MYFDVIRIQFDFNSYSSDLLVEKVQLTIIQQWLK